MKGFMRSVFKCMPLNHLLSLHHVEYIYGVKLDVRVFEEVVFGCPPLRG